MALLELGGDGLQDLAAAGHKDDVISQCCEILRHGLANALAGTRNEGIRRAGRGGK